MEDFTVFAQFYKSLTCKSTLPMRKAYHLILTEQSGHNFV
uniref:Uncharacterized protein n=1 Tax=CrAss-like virus sp. ctelJ1 TaxID=2825838 RepID=A0A8S5V2C9_9CAUD|nr:MAG TPA: hypothetical protein [CrAss-like virus sp. ctelJ1]